MTEKSTVLEMDPADLRKLYRLLLKYDEVLIIKMLPFAKLSGPGDQWLDLHVYNFVEGERQKLIKAGKKKGALLKALSLAADKFIEKKKDRTQTAIERLKKAHRRGEKIRQRINQPPR